MVGAGQRRADWRRSPFPQIISPEGDGLEAGAPARDKTQNFDVLVVMIRPDKLRPPLDRLGDPPVIS